MKHIEFPFKQTDKAEESYKHLKLAYGGKKSDNKILFVLDYVPTEDLKSGALLSGDTGKLFFTLLELAKKRYLLKDQDFTWIACNWNAYKTVGKSDDYKRDAKERFGARLKAIIDKFQPTTIVTLGKDPSRFLSPKDVDKFMGVIHKVKLEGKSYNLVPTLSLHNIQVHTNAIWLAGYVARHLGNAIAGKCQWKIKSDFESILVDTEKKFDKMLAELYKAPIAAIDTETTSLNKVQNSLLTFQACTTKDYGYFLPVHHKDSPFDTAQNKIHRKKLREYFETNKNKWHIYANAVFDLNVMRSKKNFNINYYATDVHDIFGGEFALDENAKFWSDYSDYYYSLGNLSRQYGCFFYDNAEFGKADRVTIKDRDLDEHVVKYGVADVCIPFAIREKQIEMAERIGHKSYERSIVQISDTIHTISEMESNGSGVDLKYLFNLRLPSSPIKKEINELKKKLLSSPGVVKAEAKIRKLEGIPTNGLFGSTNSSIFDLSKAKHKKILYFDVLKLKPIEEGKQGGKLDKAFQEAYADVEEVKLYTNYVKALKLENSFVKSFIKQYGKKPDFQADGRIRPSYDYLKVITGRISSNDPSLHQIPSRSELGKHIKRIFIARKGCLYIKVDFRSHEVRGWGNMSGDSLIAGVFNSGDKMIEDFKLKPTAALAEKIKLEADVHKINASYFFGIPVSKVTKEIRQDVKQIIFGLIYGMSIKSLASELDKPIEYIKDLVKKFFAKFPVGASWFDRIEAFAKKNLYVESPLGLRRNLYGYILPDSDAFKSIKGAMNRRARNSPVQGMSAQLGMTGARLLAKHCHEKDVELYINNSVHDSLENEVAYRDFFAGLTLVEYCLTKGVAKVVKKRHGWDMLSIPQVDFDFGASLSNAEGWDFDLQTLTPILINTLKFQEKELRYEIDVDEALAEIYSGFDRAPDWLKGQIQFLGEKWIKQQPKMIQKYLKPYLKA